ncbi:MAG: hypothetical protein U9N50_07695 [Pseudomonadota bacterium]|nr:hypothetical protein [Pseudomonadota bacterium]
MVIINKNRKLSCKVAVFAFTAMMLAACNQSGESTSSGVGDDSNQPLTATTVNLDAFNDFQCTSNWTNRDGGLGLTVGSGSGTCKTSFPGKSGIYQIELLAQTEREGQSPYRISINGNEVSSGKFPFSQGELICKCYKQPWAVYCPDVVMKLNAGTHQINYGDIIEYYGEEEYLCGAHGAYSKWRGMVFNPVN